MKRGAILLTLLAMAFAWWWLSRGPYATRAATFRTRLRIIGKSLVVGVIAYFCVMTAMVIYMVITGF
jgi:hypothetical protein